MYTDTLDGNSVLMDQAPRFANFGPRLGAAVLDFLICLPLFFGAMYFQVSSPSFTNYLMVTLVATLYKPVLEGLYGATPGKMILKLKVVNKDFSKISFAQAFIRFVPWIIATLIGVYFAQMVFQAPGLEDVEGFMEYNMFVAEWQQENMSTGARILQGGVGFLPLLSALIILFNKKRQAAHDFLAETFVIHKEPKTTGL